VELEVQEQLKRSEMDLVQVMHLPLLTQLPLVLRYLLALHLG
jgi:hypothetical protein